MKTKFKTYLTPAEYLALERASVDAKREYVDGEMVEMKGASRYHNLIVTNLIFAFGKELNRSLYELYPGDMRVWVPGADGTLLYTYPDIVIARRGPKLTDDHCDTLIDPLVIIEVLSPSTTRRDRGIKLSRSRALPSLREYLLIAQDRPRAELHSRGGPHGPWLTAVRSSLATSLFLPSISCRLALSEIYEWIAFES
jgi:Uma2 family endonuclease